MGKEKMKTGKVNISQDVLDSIMKKLKTAIANFCVILRKRWGSLFFTS
ncbi:MAG: hypothetical protein HY810_05300 [Candidatus Omnitrophica bacterium]|nr:hypothetical protein [Candidatus Omnitrophota bacterium]